MKKILLTLMIFGIVGCASDYVPDPNRVTTSCIASESDDYFSPKVVQHICTEYPSRHISFKGGYKKYPNGRKYRQGYGTEFFKNGSSFTGYYDGGKRSGYGTFKSEVSSRKYFWTNGEINRNYDVESTYNGEFQGHKRVGRINQNNNWDGKIKYIFPSGQINEMIYEDGEELSSKVIKTSSQAKKESKQKKDDADLYSTIYSKCILDKTSESSGSVSFEVRQACRNIASNPSMFDKLKYGW